MPGAEGQSVLEKEEKTRRLIGRRSHPPSLPPEGYLYIVVEECTWTVESTSVETDAGAPIFWEKDLLFSSLTREKFIGEFELLNWGEALKARIWLTAGCALPKRAKGAAAAAPNPPEVGDDCAHISSGGGGAPKD